MKIITLTKERTVSLTLEKYLNANKLAVAMPSFS
ncbi:hypothetical protein T12_830 [Trichinella patagoniensis]|uniref:Uncharacterized protein n=1 Tax=Trichinella patagoniensis TaxID=990121 RepID=A0A0V0YT37_9BILA|nr:hypothetical protein T12_830 [Trichinella patagoniensis]